MVQDFQKKYRESANVYDLIRFFKRVERETDLLGIDGDNLRDILRKMISALTSLRDMNQERIVGEEWQKWSEALESIRKNPLKPEVTQYLNLSPKKIKGSETIANSNEPKSFSDKAQSSESSLNIQTPTAKTQSG